VLRRDLITLLGGTAAGCWPFGVRGQTLSARRLGILLYSTQDRKVIKPLLDELQARWYIDGKTLHIDYRDAEEKYDRLAELAAELVHPGPDVLFGYSGELAPILKRSTTEIPIVVVVSNDPVESGLVNSLARPGVNVTGLTFIYDQLAGKASSYLRKSRLQYPALRYSGIQIIQTLSSARLSVVHARCRSSCIHWRCESPLISTMHLRPPFASVPKP
jgi:ABC transporter substrate binding protein